MSDALVSITHPVDPGALIPFINGNAPQTKIVIPSAHAPLIAEMGFDVEVHADPYDPVTAHNEAVAARLAEVAAAEPEAAPAEPKRPAPVAEPAPAPVEPAATEPEQPATPEASGGEGDQQSGEEGTEEVEEGMSLEELQALRATVEGLTALADAKKLLDELQIALDPMPDRLRDVKAELLKVVDQEIANARQ